MAHVITKEEVLKIARLSNLLVFDKEINQMTNQLDSVLSYAARVKEITGSIEDFLHEEMKQNKVRLDVVDQLSSEVLLSQLPAREGNLIVVPMILETV